MCFLYSAQVVAAIVRSLPRARAGFSKIRGIAGAGSPAGADERVGLVDEQDDRLLRRLHLFDYLLQAILELALHAGAGLQRADIEREQPNIAKRRRHVAGGDSQAQTLRRRPFCRRPLRR